MFLNKKNKILILHNNDKIFLKLKKKINNDDEIKSIKIKKKIKLDNLKCNILINIFDTKKIDSYYLSNIIFKIVNIQTKNFLGNNKNIVNILNVDKKFPINISTITNKISKIFGRKKIRINTIILQKKLNNVEIDELNQFIIFLTSSKASYISGTTITI